MLQALPVGLMATETETIRQASQLLEQIKNKMPQDWDASCYADNYLAWKEIAEFNQLKKAVSGNWEELLENIKDIAPSEIHQIVLFVSLSYLPLQDSFRCLDKVADLCLNNVISKEMFGWVRTIYEVYTAPRYRLAFHHKDPVVVELLRKAKIIQPAMAEHYDRVLSGEESKDLIIWFEESGESKPAYLDDLLAAKQGTEIAAEESQPVRNKGSIPPVVSVTSESGDAADDIGLAIVAAARSQIGKTVKYDSSYAKLEYPMGDVPIETGVCTDVIIRALRDALNMDLQQLVHQDMKASFLLYPKRWGFKFPDKNIDHRRTLNLMKYFERKGFSLPVSDNPEDYLPGDIIAADVHIVIVSDKKNEHGIPLVIHNIGRGAREESYHFLSGTTGHYRITHKGRQSLLNNAIVLVGVAIIIGGIVVAWRYFKRRSKCGHDCAQVV